VPGDRRKIKIQRANYCSLLKPKIPKYREPNERNAEGSSITINFHPSCGEETYLKAKNCSNFADVLRCINSMFKLFFTLTRKLEFCPTAFAVIYRPVALPIIPKVEFKFEVIMYITLFVS